MPIVHLKLANGDELLARKVDESRKTISLVDPLEVNSGGEDSPSPVYVSPYLTFSDDHFMKVDRKKILMMYEVNEIARDFYETSLEFTRGHILPQIMTGIEKTTESLDKALRPPKEEKVETQLSFGFMGKLPSARA